MLEVENLIELSNMEEKDIIALIGKEAGRQVYRFLNRSAFGG
jgi:DNA excision repair protein ERCC-4